MPVDITRKDKHTGKTTTKVYETVAERLLKFRKDYTIDKGWSLTTEMSFKDQIVRCEARIITPDDRIVAIGHAEENRAGSYINKTSAVENCETSAIGRCLFAAGLGGGEFCSADELLMAIKKQEEIGSMTSGKSQQGSSKGKTASPPQGADSKPIEKEDADLLKIKPIKGISYEKQGNVIIAKGRTYSVKGLLENNGFKWNPELNAWSMYLS